MAQQLGIRLLRRSRTQHGLTKHLPNLSCLFGSLPVALFTALAIMHSSAALSQTTLDANYLADNASEMGSTLDTNDSTNTTSPFTVNPSSAAANAVIELNQRIIGGSRAVSGEWPSVVALVRARGSFSLAERQFCGGTIIASRWVATAAHCLFDTFHTQIDPSSFRVVAGITNLRTDVPDEETVVVNMIIHPDYVPSNVTSPNDIALLELATELPASIPLLGADPAGLTGADAHVVGWGATDFSNPKNPVYPDDLQEATVPIVSNSVCNAPQSYNGLVTSTQLCAGFQAGQVDACTGDSGGPLFAEVAGLRVLIGIVSFGRGCAEPNFFGIYTSIAHFSEWIQEFVEVADIQTRGLPLLTIDSGKVPGMGLGSGSSADPDERPDDDGSFGGLGGVGFGIVALLLCVAGVRRRR